MGREVRRVPPNWEHPKNSEGHLQPFHDRDYETAMSTWISNHNLWLEGKHPSQVEHPEETKEYKYFAQWDGNAPDVEYYRPKWEVEPTWYQLYETVSEGTPVSPAFATPEELIEHLVKRGDGWPDGVGLSRKAAENLVRGGWCPSLIVTGGKVYKGAEGLVVDQ